MSERRAPEPLNAPICLPTGKMEMTKSEAKKTARMQERRAEFSGRPIEAYRCRVCLAWHIGHRPPKAA